MTLRLLIKRHLDFLSSKVGCPGLSESNHVKMPHCWKSHVTAHILFIWTYEFVLRFSSISAMAAVYAIYDWGEKKNHVLSRKNPADYVNDE